MSPKTRNQKLLGYVRVSRMKEDGISPDLQRSAIEAYAIAHGHEIIWLDPDLDESGKSLDRPSMQDALGRLARKEADGIISAKLDRLTRKVSDLGRLLQLADEQDWNLVAIDLGVDLTTSNGKLVAQLLGSIAEWELDRRREGWREAKSNAVERGVHISARVPAGYTRDPRTKVLVPNQDAPAILEAFEARADGATWHEVAEILTAAGVAKSRSTDDAAWSEYAVAALCENRVYLGEARGGKGVVNENAHEPIVSPGLFARVQARKGQKDSYLDPTRRRELLAGLVRCGGCGRAMVVDQRVKDGKVVQRYFRCTSGSACSARAAVSTRVLEDYVFTYLREHGAELNIVAPRSNDQAVRAAEIALANAQAEIAAFLANVPATTPGYGEAVAQRQAAVDDAAQALNATAAGGGKGDWEGLGEVADEDIALRVVLDPDKPVSGHLLALHILSVDQTDNPKARRLLRQLVEKVTVEKGRAPIAERVTVTLV